MLHSVLRIDNPLLCHGMVADIWCVCVVCASVLAKYMTFYKSLLLGVYLNILITSPQTTNYFLYTDILAFALSEHLLLPTGLKRINSVRTSTVTFFRN